MDKEETNYRDRQPGSKPELVPKIDNCEILGSPEM